MPNIIIIIIIITKNYDLKKHILKKSAFVGFWVATSEGKKKKEKRKIVNVAFIHSLCSSQTYRKDD
jgi:hypothetical protein